MKVFFDTSALVKRYIREKGTDRVLDIFSQSKEIVVSILSLPEVISTLQRVKVERKLSVDQYQDRKKEFLIDLGDFSVCDLTPEVMSTTLNLIETSSIRTLDALQLASALLVKADLFISSDRQQILAAKKHRIKVEAV